MGALWTTDEKTDEQRALWTFDGGIDTFMHPQFITTSQSSDEYGATISGQVAVKNAKNRTQLGAVGGGVGQMIGVYRNTTLLRAVSGKIQRWSGTAWVDVITGLDPNARIEMTNFEFGGKPAVLFTNGVNPPKYWDGTATGDLNTANAPKGKHIMNDTVRVFIAKDDVLHFCARLSADNWTKQKDSGFIQVYTPQGGDIIGMIRSLGMRLVFKKDYIGDLHGNNLTEYQLIDVSTQIGCYDALTIQEVQGLIFWVGYKQVYAFAGGQPVPIGDPIMKWLEAVDWSNPSMFAVTDGDNYILGLGNAVLSYSPKFKIWRVNRVGQVNKMGTLFNNEWYTMDATGTVFKEGIATPIEMSITSPAFTEGSPELWKEYYELHIQARIHSGNLKVYASSSVDGNDFVLIDTVTGNGTVETAHIVPMDSFPLCHWLRLRIVADDAELLSCERFYNLLPADH